MINGICREALNVDFRQNLTLDGAPENVVLPIALCWWRTGSD